jgi:hypothetical protein
LETEAAAQLREKTLSELPDKKFRYTHVFYFYVLLSIPAAWAVLYFIDHRLTAKELILSAFILVAPPILLAHILAWIFHRDSTDLNLRSGHELIRREKIDPNERSGAVLHSEWAISGILDGEKLFYLSSLRARLTVDLLIVQNITSVPWLAHWKIPVDAISHVRIITRKHYFSRRRILVVDFERGGAKRILYLYVRNPDAWRSAFDRLNLSVCDEASEPPHGTAP